MSAAVMSSVTMMVRSSPSRVASRPQRNFPEAPPTKTSPSATPSSPTGAPFARSRNERKARNPVRVPLSMSEIPASEMKPG
jgi:hypothetical protein